MNDPFPANMEAPGGRGATSALRPASFLQALENLLPHNDPRILDNLAKPYNTFHPEVSFGPHATPGAGGTGAGASVAGTGTLPGSDS